MTCTKCIKHEIDATNIPVGRLATRIAVLLRGKNKPTFQPNVDGGDSVIVKNAAKIKFTGRKLEQKDYYRHTMHPGGIKRTPAKKLLAKDPGAVIRLAVKRMLPDNRQRTNLMKRLTIHA